MAGYIGPDGKEYSIGEIDALRAAQPKQKVFDRVFDSNSAPTVEQNAMAMAKAYGVYSQVDPDQEARDREAAKILDVPQYALRLSPDIRKQSLLIAQAKQNSPDDWGSFSEENPYTAKYLANPDNMTVSHDDISNLSKIENVITSFKTADKLSQLREERGKIGESLWSSGGRVDSLDPDTRERLVRINNEIGSLSSQLPKSNWSAEGIAAGIGSMGAAAREGFKMGAAGGAAGGTAGGLAGSLVGGVGAIPGAVAGAASGAGYGFTVGMAKAFGEDSWGNTYLDLVARRDINGMPMDVKAAQVGAALNGTLNAALGSIQFGRLIERIPGGQEILATFSKTVPEQVLQNPITATAAWKTFVVNYGLTVVEQGALGGAMEAANIASERTAEYWSGQRFSHSGEPSAMDRISEAALNMLPVGAVLSLPGASLGLARDLRLKTNGDLQQKALMDLAQGLQDSKTIGRLPSNIKDFIEGATIDTPVENVYIPGESFLNYFSGEGKDSAVAMQVAERLGVTEQLQEALATGGNIKLSLANIATNLGRTEHFKNLIPDMKFNEEDLTPRQREQVYKDAKESLNNVAYREPGETNIDGKQESILDDTKSYSEAVSKSDEHINRTVEERQQAEQSPEFQGKLAKAIEWAKGHIEKQIGESPLYKASDFLKFDLQMFAAKDVKEVAKKYKENKLTPEAQAKFETISDEHGFSSADELATSIIKGKTKEEAIKSQLEEFARDYKDRKLGNPDEVKIQAEMNENRMKATGMEAAVFGAIAKGEHTTGDRKKREAEINKRWKDAETKLVAEMEKAKTAEQILRLEKEIDDLNKQHKDELEQLKKEADYNSRWSDAEANRAESDRKAKDNHDWKLAKEWLKAEGVSQRLARKAEIGIKAATETARELLANKSIVDASNWQRYMQLARNAAAKAEQAYRKGKYEEAATWKNVEMLNHALGIESVKVKKEIDKGIRLFKKIDKRKDTAMSVGDRYQVDKLLERFGLTKRPPDPGAIPEDRLSLLQWVQEKQENGWPLEISNILLDESYRKDCKELTLDEFRDLKDAISQVEQVGRNFNRLLKSFDKIDLNEAIKKLSDSALDNVGVKHPFTSDPNANKILSIPDIINANLLKVETICEELDGFTKKFGAWAEGFVFPFSKAYNEKVRKLEKATTDLDQILNKYYSSKELGKFRLVDTYIESLGYSLSKENMLSVLLNWGNKGNRQRLLDGKRWTVENVQEIFSKLTEKDFDFAQEIWDYLDSYYPEMAALHQRTVGGILKKVEADAFSWNGKEYKGGYYPAVPDRTMSIEAQVNESKLAMGKYADNSFKASAKAGATQSRASKATYQLRLDLDVIHQHLNEIIHDITHREAIIDANRILYSKDIKQVLSQTKGDVFWHTLDNYLKDIASEGRIKNTEIEQAAAKLRGRISVATMAYKFSVMIPQVLGVFQIGEKLGYGRTAASMFKFMKSLDYKDLVNQAYTKSAFMADRSSNFDRDGRILLQKHFGQDSKLEQVNKMGFWLMGLFDQVATIPCWHEAYKDGMKTYAGDEARAIEHADSIIRQTIGSGLPKDMAQFMRGSEWQKWLTMFSSFTNAMYNLTYRRYKITTGAGDYSLAQRISGAMAFVTFNLFAQPIVNEILAGRSGDDKKKRAQWAAANIAKNMAGMVPVVGQIANFTISKATGEYANYRSTPFDSVVESFDKVITQGIKTYNNTGKKTDLVKAIANFASFALPYPQEFNIAAGNIYDKLHGEKIEWYEIPYHHQKNKK